MPRIMLNGVLRNYIAWAARGRTGLLPVHIILSDESNSNAELTQHETVEVSGDFQLGCWWEC